MDGHRKLVERGLGAQGLDARGLGARGIGAAADCAERDRPWVLAATILGSAMGFIDGTLAHIALPAIQADLGARFDQLQWVATIYLLALSALIVAGGGLGDRIGRKRVFMAGVALFGLASVACAAAPTVEALILARGVKGVGAALMIPQSLAILAAAYPKERRGAAIGLWASASALTTAIGPVVGGVFVDTLGWRAAFWINLPLAAATLALAAARMPEGRAAQDTEPGGAAGWASLDWAGAGASALALGALTWAMIAAPERGMDAAVLVALAAGAAAALALPSIERRARAPIAPPALFRDRVFLAANALTLALYGGLGAALFLVPYDLIGRRGFSAAEVGLVLLPFGAAIGLLSQWGGRLGDRFGPRAPLGWGSLLFAAGCAALGLSAGAPFWLGVLAPFLLMGLGMALAVAPLTTAVMNAAPDALAGAASGTNNAVSRAAGLLAVAAVGALAAAVYAAMRESGAPARFDGAIGVAAGASGAAARDAALTAGYLACGALGLAAAGLARFLPGAPAPSPRNG